METPPETDSSLTDATKRVVWRVMTIFHNRCELLLVEIQEERERARVMISLAVAAAVFGLLGAMCLSALIVLAAGKYYLIALVILTICYVGGALILFRMVSKLGQEWEPLPGTREQLTKDRECLEKQLF